MSEETEIDKYEPDWSKSCSVCGLSPVVTAVKDGKVGYSSEMCGPCTFGEEACIDPKQW